MPPRSPPWGSQYSQGTSASYLSNLRTNRPVRPGGSRPLPPRISVANHENDQDALQGSEHVFSVRQNEGTDGGVISKRQSMSQLVSPPAFDSHKGRPLVQAPDGTQPIGGRKVSPSSLSYRESTARQLEKQEAHKLRQALQRIDQEDEETRIHSAAQMEAADLVWKHRNPQLAEHEKTAAYKNPDLAKKRYMIQDKGSALDSQGYSGADQSRSISSEPHEQDKVEPLRFTKRRSQGITSESIQASRSPNSRRRSSGSRQVSNGSSKGVFRNPDDQIYEEPEEWSRDAEGKVTAELPLRSRDRNSLPKGSRPLPEKPHTVPQVEQARLNRYEIWKNPPSQSRKADYAVNNDTVRSQTPEPIVETPKGRALEIRSEEIRAATSMKKKDRSPKLPTPTAVSDRPGRPIVSFDPAWRPGNDSPRGSLDVERPPIRPMPDIPATTVSAPAVPTINLPDDDHGIPSINLPDRHDIPQSNVPDEQPDFPTICVTDVSTIPNIVLNDDPPATQRSNMPHVSISEDIPSPRPLPIINVQSQQPEQPRSRPVPTHTQSSPPKLPPSGTARGPASRLPWLSRSATGSSFSGSRTTIVTCAACDLPISGRIVTASGSASNNLKARFHPECFSCFHCSAALECVSFYPEPESALLERLGLTPDPATQHSEGDDAQQPQPEACDLRFYCHLDYHELFSPKCASCHTPIEGAVVLAAGKAWHEGHFFCAECGDPFSSSSPFVENKGYAYCVSCHTRRTSARCRACKNQILDEISVEALGGKWHESCFVCEECSGGFGDDGRFFLREVEVELTEKEKRKGMSQKKIEERAVCEGCEDRRLKSWDVDAFL